MNRFDICFFFFVRVTRVFELLNIIGICLLIPHINLYNFITLHNSARAPASITGDTRWLSTCARFPLQKRGKDEAANFIHMTRPFRWAEL
jgi:hypothetical protein